MIHKQIPYRRHQRQRVIHKRILKLKNSWLKPFLTEDFFKKAGRYAKWNLSCNCWMCRTKTREIGNKISEQRKLLREKDGENDEQPFN